MNNETCKVLSSENLIELNKLYNNKSDIETSTVIHSETYSILNENIILDYDENIEVENDYKLDNDIENNLEINNIKIKEDNNFNLLEYLRNKKDNYYVNFIFQILLHIILLSIFETLLFFKYISKIEQEIFMEKINEYLEMVSDQEIKHNLIDYFDFYINYQLNNPEFEEYIYGLENEYYKGIERRENYNDELEKKSYNVSIVISTIFIGFLSLCFLRYKIRLPKMLFENFVLMMCIIIYEVWFLLVIALDYKTITSDELFYIFVTCIIKESDENYENIDIDYNITKLCPL
jgi:hypothetical protein